MNKKLLFVLGLILGVTFTMLLNSNPENLGAVRGANVFSGGVTNASTTVSSTTATSILTRDTNRMYAVICNNDSTNPVYLHFDSATTTVLVNAGYKLTAGNCYEIDGDNLYLGRIYGISTGGAVVVTTLYK